MTEVETSAPASALLPPDEMEPAYYEFRKACYAVVYREAKARGVIDCLGVPRTAGQLARDLDFDPDREDVVELFLRALVRFGALTFSDAKYVVRPEFDEDEALDVDPELIAKAVGKDSVEALVHGASYAGIVDALTKEKPETSVAATFESANKELWEEFLNVPFYRYGRVRAVAAIAKEGAVLLDLASGPGFGLVELAEQVGEDGGVTGAEFSGHFVSEAAQRTEKLPGTQIIQCNLDEGLPFLRDNYFDGAMLVGAFHYIMNRDVLFSEVGRVLKPGGRFCLALVHMARGTYDQELMDLRLRLRQPPASPATRPEIEALATRHGFRLESDEFSLGVYGWFLAVKE